MKIVIGTLTVSLIVAVTAGLLITHYGIFNVSTSWQDPPLWHWVLSTARERSVHRRAAGIEIPDLADKAMIERGFRSYRDMCTGCHGTPGGSASALAQGLNPPPPDLSDPEHNESAQRVFWVVKNGIRMTGMPGWGATHDDRSLWEIVAFVRTVPGMTAAQYQALDSRLLPGHSHGNDHGHNHQADTDNASSPAEVEQHHMH